MEPSLSILTLRTDKGGVRVCVGEFGGRSQIQEAAEKEENKTHVHALT